MVDSREFGKWRGQFKQHCEGGGNPPLSPSQPLLWLEVASRAVMEQT